MKTLFCLSLREISNGASVLHISFHCLKLMKQVAWRDPQAPELPTSGAVEPKPLGHPARPCLPIHRLSAVMGHELSVYPCRPLPTHLHPALPIGGGSPPGLYQWRPLTSRKPQMEMRERQPLSPFPYLSNWYCPRILAFLLALPP